MLASPEEAYTDYLEHVVTEAGVDPVIVRDTLRQLGYDNDTIAVIMGEACATLFPSSSSSSSTSSSASAKVMSKASSSVSSSEATQRSGMAAAKVSSSAPSEKSHLPVCGAAHAPENAIEGGTVSASGTVFVQPPSIMHESKLVGHTPTSASLSCSAALQEKENTKEVEATGKSVDGQALGKNATVTESRVTEAALCHPAPSSSSSSSGQRSSSSPSQRRSIHYTESLSRSSGGMDNQLNPNSSSGDFTSADRDVLLRWMNEYKALLLSSAMPRRASASRKGPPAKKLALVEPFDERHHVLQSEADTVSSTYDEGVHEGFPRGTDVGLSPTRPCRRKKYSGEADSPLSATTTTTSSGGCSGSASFLSASSSSTVPANTHRQRRGQSASAHHRVGYPVVRDTGVNGCWRRRLSAHPKAAPPGPFRHVVPKAKSSLFVPTYGLMSPRRRTTSGQWAVKERDCRHPYREAQDVRIVRASQSLASEVGHGQRNDGQSQSLARQLDVARQTQHTSRAEPAGGRRIPIMHAPVQPYVHPRSGLATGRQTITTLPPAARTDRVSLACYYRRQWEKQERRNIATSRDAAWDTRYALLSCTNGQQGS
jgi:hypothetical protein